MDKNNVILDETADIQIVEHKKRTLSGRKRKDIESFEVKWSLPPFVKPAPRERTGAFYQQEFTVLESRPLTELERAASAQRGFIRKDRRKTRRTKRGNR